MFSIDKRPQQLNEVVGEKTPGQKIVLKDMKQYSKTIEFPQYLLFYGNSGTGKSTTAFIIAKLINCHSPVLNDEGYYDPCNECPSCTDIINQKFIRNVFYKDASHMGKQEVHNLKKIITSAPMYRESKRIIIIDEAHLLNSKEARGAMLTLMEEKSSNFMFILCTTDVSKFDKAFMDRLKSYHFRGASSYDIGQYLINVFNNSDIDDSKVTEEQLKEFTKKGIPLLIENSEGSLRRAVSLLEQCIERSAYTEKQILENLDIVNTDKMIDVFHDVINGSIEKVFEYLEYEVEDLDFFYNYLYKLLYESRIYKHTKKADSDYKEKMYNKLLNKRGENLYNMFIEFEQNKQGYYFNKRLFKSKLLQFMEQSKKLEEVPVRIKKREKA